MQSALLTIFVEELGELLRGLTNTGDEVQGGSVTFVQLFGSSLNLHVHFHLLALDGVEDCPERSRRMPDGEERPPKFVRAPAPTREQLGGLVRSVALRARQLLSRKPAPEPVEELQQPAFKLFGARQQPLAVSDLGLPAVVPAVAPARIDQGELWPTGPPALHDRVAPSQDQFDQRDHLDAA